MKCRSLHIFTLDGKPALQFWTTGQTAAVSIHDAADAHRGDDIMVHVPKHYISALSAGVDAFNDAFDKIVNQEAEAAE